MPTYKDFQHFAQSKDKDRDYIHHDVNQLYKRSNYTSALIQWIRQTLPILINQESLHILNLGCGFSAFTIALYQLFKQQHHHVYYLDSPEMLSHLP